MKRLTIIASLFALFVFGGICGFAVAVRIVKNTLNEQHWVHERAKEESKRLKLTPDQITKAQPSYDELQKALAKAREDTVIAITSAAMKQGRDLAALLTPEQLEAFKTLSEERRQRFEKASKP
jgi:Spy/CpxP family protein refolding chaperone